MSNKELEKIRVFVSNKFGVRNYQEHPVVTPFEVVDWIKEYMNQSATHQNDTNITPSAGG